MAIIKMMAESIYCSVDGRGRFDTLTVVGDGVKDFEVKISVELSRMIGLATRLGKDEAIKEMEE